jgi:riboflavin biosynthesis pyrimidine reductase
VIDLLWEEHGLPEQPLPDALRDLYGGGLGFDGPVLYTNFVETLDGVVAIPTLEQSNALVGSGTLLASPKGKWRPAGVYPAAADAFAELGDPAVAVVSSGASLDTSHPVLQTAVVLTTTRGAELLEGLLPDVVAVNDGDWVDVRAAVAALRARGHQRILSEAGPTVFGSLLADALVDELFLTLSPVLAGWLAVGGRLGLVEGVELLPQVRVGGRLRSVRKSDEHLFLRYALC